MPSNMRSLLSISLTIILLAAALQCLPAQAEPLAPRTAESADLVVVLKADRQLYLYRDDMPIRRYSIQLGGVPYGHKTKQGDQRTPEGAYTLDWRNPESSFYRSIHIDYPNARDLQRSSGLNIDPGGQIMIHGQPSYDSRPRSGDWTDGCIAVSNDAMDELWELIPQDTPIHIYP